MGCRNFSRGYNNIMESLNFLESKKLLEKYKIPFVKTKLCTSKKEALDFAKRIGFPVALKISSPEILHKTDVGGVKLGIETETDLRKAWDEIQKVVKQKVPKVKLEGILVQEMVFGREIALGMKRDAIFGPVLMFGLGGIFVEVLKDVVFRVTPVDKKEAKNMITQIKGFEILKGFRGQEKVNLEKLTEIITKFSKLSLLEKDLREIDLSPIMANGKGSYILDARFLL